MTGNKNGISSNPKQLRVMSGISPGPRISGAVGAGIVQFLRVLDLAGPVSATVGVARKVAQIRAAFAIRRLGAEAR